MSSKTTVLIPLDVKKSVDCMTERAGFGIQARKLVLVEETKEIELFLASEIVLVRSVFIS